MKINTLTSIALWIVSSLVHSSSAQTPTNPTLQSLWPKVRQHYSGIAAKNAKIQASEFHQRSVRSRALPQVKLQLQNTYGTFNSSPGAFFSQPGLFNVSGSVPTFNGSSMTANSYASSTIEWELYHFGRLDHEQHAATARLEKDIQERNAYILELKKALSERYVELLYHEAKADWSMKNVQRLSEIKTITSGLSASGLRPAADSLLAASAVEQAIGEKERWTGVLQAALHQLQELTGQMEIEAASAMKRFLQPMVKETSRFTEVPESHPTLDALQEQATYFEETGKAKQSAALPAIRLLGGYAARGSGIAPNGQVSGAWKDGFRDGTSNLLAGVGVIWNLTRLHTNRLQSAAFEKKAEKFQHLRQRQQNAMQAELAASHTRIRQQYAQLVHTQSAVKTSRDAYNMYLSRYKSGLIALSEVLQIRSLLEIAEGAQIDAAREYWLNLAIEAELSTDFEFLFRNL